MKVKNTWRLFPFHIYFRILFFVILAGFSSDLLKKLSSPYYWWGVSEEPAWKHRVIWRDELPDSLNRSYFPVIGIYSNAFITASSQLCSDLNDYARRYQVKPVSVFNYPHPTYLGFCADAAASTNLSRYQYWLDTTGLTTVMSARKSLERDPPAFIAYQRITGVVEAHSRSYANGNRGAGQIMSEFIESLIKRRYSVIRIYRLGTSQFLFLYARKDFAKEKSNAF